MWQKEDMIMSFPFDSQKRTEEVEEIVMRGGKRLYYRFRPAPYYGGIATADAVGCNFLCAYCWNYNRNMHPERFREFYSPQQVAAKLLHIAKKKSFRLFRISGAEPVLGERTLGHLVEVLKFIDRSNPDSMFVLETNGFCLGQRAELGDRLKEFHNLRVRVCLKGVDEESFEQITGADREFFLYPIEAVKGLERLGIMAWPALMGDLFSREDILGFKRFLRQNGVRSELELESLEAYPFVLKNMKKRGFKI
jgi:uncharacterized Fe-S cluster-containing radical SAM superfamily protein